MEKQTVIAVVGGKKSGKTTTIEKLTRELADRGYRVAVVKHVPESGFTIDREGKDTWRYTQSGARTVVAASPHEIATIEKLSDVDLSLDDILRRCGNSDVVFLEGFRQQVAKVKGIYKIVVARSQDDVASAIMFDPLLVFTGPYVPEERTLAKPYFDVLKDPGKVADLIEGLMRKKR
jgi:molybdopterin-guanine dinucleotide biosynthesis protein MobB